MDEAEAPRAPDDPSRPGRRPRCSQETEAGRRWRPGCGTLVMVVLSLACLGGLGLGILDDVILPQYTAGATPTVERYYQAAREGDFATAHALLTPALAARLSPDDLRALSTAADAREGPIVAVFARLPSDVRIARATVEVEITRRRAEGIVLVRVAKVGDRWLIDAFDTP